MEIITKITETKFSCPLGRTTKFPFSPAQEQLKLTAPGKQVHFFLALPAKTTHVSSFTNSLSCILQKKSTFFLMVFICIALLQIDKFFLQHTVIWLSCEFYTLLINDYFAQHFEGLFFGLALFPRSRLATLFFVKISTCSYERLGWLGYRDLSFCDRDLGNRDENFSYEHSSPETGTKLFKQNSFALTT